MFNVCEVKNTFGIRTVTVFRENANDTFDTLAIRKNQSGMVKIDYPTTQEYDTVKRSFSVICGKDKQRRKIVYQFIPKVGLKDDVPSHTITVTSDYVRYCDAEREIRRMSPDTANDILDLLGDDLPNEKLEQSMAELFGFGESDRIPVELGQDRESPQTPSDRLAHVQTEHDGRISIFCVWRNGHHYGDFECPAKAQAVADSLNGVYSGEVTSAKVEEMPLATSENAVRSYEVPRTFHQTTLREAIVPPTGQKMFKTTSRIEYCQRELAEPVSIY